MQKQLVMQDPSCTPDGGIQRPEKKFGDCFNSAAFTLGTKKRPCVDPAATKEEIFATL